jgi:hypothetical protein
VPLLFKLAKKEGKEFLPFNFGGLKPTFRRFMFGVCRVVRCLIVAERMNKR